MKRETLAPVLTQLLIVTCADNELPPLAGATLHFRSKK